MKAQTDKSERRGRRRRRSKKMLQRRPYQYRLVVYRSLRHIYGQVVNDLKGETVVSASTLEPELQPRLKDAKSKVDRSEVIGRVLAERAKAKKIRKVVFDRNGFLYHGRVKALAEGARGGGLEF